MKTANEKSLRCACPRSSALAALLGCLGVAALAAGCGVEPTPEEEAAELAELTAQEPGVPAALDFVKPPPVPIVRPSFPAPPPAPPSPSPLPSLEAREASALTACPGVRERRLRVVLVRDGVPSAAPRTSR
jgi:hypothetical protein